MRDIRVVTESELRDAVGLNRETVDVIEAAFKSLSAGKVIQPPILSMDIPQANAEVDIKTAYIDGFDGFAIKVSPGFFDNPAIGLSSLNGLMILFSAKTGLVETVFLDNGYLTDIRTAAAGGVAARHLAPKHVETLGIVGTGVQARLQARAACLERSVQQIVVWGRTLDKAADLAQDLKNELAIAARAVGSVSELMKASQLVVTTTPSTSPLIQLEDLHPGLHITAIGSDQPGKCEISPRAIAGADLYVCDKLSQCQTSGELERALEMGLMRGQTPPELGDVIAGTSGGRRTEEDITICDLTGTGVQDTAIATYVSGRLGNAGVVIRA